MKLTNEYYNKFLEFKERVKNKDFKRTEEFISNHHKNILLKMGVYEFDVKNGYSFKDIGVIEFNELLAAKVKNKPIIYVFDNDFNLIYADCNCKHLSKLFGNSENTIVRRLKNKEVLSNDYYYSFSKENIKSKKVSVISETGRDNIKKGQQEWIKRNRIKFKKIADDLMNDEHLLVKPLRDIGEKYNVSYRTVSHWFNSHKEFKEVAEKRNVLINKIKSKLKKERELIKIKKIKVASVTTFEHKQILKKTAKDQLIIAKDQNKPIKRLGKYGSKEEIRKALGIK